MSISAINSYSPVSFTAAPAKASAKANKNPNIAKTVAIVGLGLTAAALATYAIIHGKQAKAAEVVETATQNILSREKNIQQASDLLSSVAEKQIPAKDLQKYSDGQKLKNLIDTAKISGEIAEVEARIAKSTESHDELQKMYEGLFKAAEDVANNAA